MIAAIDHITPEWLTQVLYDSGALPQGRVSSVQAAVADSNTATAARLAISYSADASPETPKSLFVKLGRRQLEVAFYQTIVPAMPESPAPRCYAASFSPETGGSYLLFDDFSATHTVPEGALPPPLADTERLADALATFHAHWWQHPRLQGDIAEITEDVPAYVVGVARAAFADFVGLLGDRLSAQRRQIYERIFEVWPLPALLARRATGQHTTLLHGDTHYWNFLSPRDPSVERVKIIDWAVWHIGIGPADLAYMITLFWFPERRARMEQDLVRRYHSRLLAQGVVDYSWEQCWLDYRTALVFHLLWPIFWHRYLPESIWWNTLEKAMLAFEDLGCAELL